MKDKLYSIEFAVKSTTEFMAMERLKELGLSRADEAKLSDLDRQAGLFIIKSNTDESELTDVVYKKILSAKDISILSDELSAKRAGEIITLTTVVENQLKKLLVCILPETEKVLAEIINTHQKHKSKFIPTDRIEWCDKIKDFSFGELPFVLREDISKIAKKQLLSDQGLLSLISTSHDFDKLKATIIEISKSKTVWNSINFILEKPVEYSYIATALDDLCDVRNNASHLKTITVKQLLIAQKNQKHIMSHIGNLKSSYRDRLQSSMKSLADSMRLLLESASKIDPSIFAEYQRNMVDMIKPFTDTVSKLQLDFISPHFIETIKQNANYQSQITKSFEDIGENMKNMNGYNEMVKKISEVGITKLTADYMKEMDELKSDMGKITDGNKNRTKDE